MTAVGLEPTIFGSEERHLIHWTTWPSDRYYHPRARRAKHQYCFVHKKILPRGLEPRTLQLLAARSDQLSYKSLIWHTVIVSTMIGI